MGVQAAYCFFCSGPFANAYEKWRDNIEYTGSQAMRESKFEEAAIEAVLAKRLLITEEDGEYWDYTVCVSARWPESFVSPPCSVGCYWDVWFEDDSEDGFSLMDDHFILIHRGCLSLACRWLDITPEQLWNTFCNQETVPEHICSSPYPEGKTEQVSYYYDIESRALQEFVYGSTHDGGWKNEYLPDFELYLRRVEVKAKEKDDASDKEPSTPGESGDYRSESDCNWLLAAPTAFPHLLGPQYHRFPLSELQTASTTARVLQTPDLLLIILDWLVPHRTEADIEAGLLETPDDEDVPPFYESLQALFSLMRVNKQYYTLITRHRQDLFFRLVWQSGWMLPVCPSDWNSWEEINPPLPLLTGASIEYMSKTRETTPFNDYDWRAYLLTFMRRKDPHVKSRYRMRRMTIQLAQLVHDEASSTRLGTLAPGTSFSRPTPYSWEEDDE